MKKAVLLNAPVSTVISELGHGDMLCVCDAGLPIPDSVERIDLAVRAGLPSFLDTLKAVITEMCVERVIIAAELKDKQPDLLAVLTTMIQNLGTEQGNEIAIEVMSHEDFKTQSQDCKAIVRTGECSPFANIILVAGVTF